jgi:ligand-binding sensor domain-containing protein/two-component sensor histidine kinase
MYSASSRVTSKKIPVKSYRCKKFPIEKQALLLLFFFLGFFLPLQSQVYHTTRYSTADGLVQSQVFALMQDDQGYLWLGTHRGICRFDGKTFRPYGVREGLSGFFVTAIIEDQAGEIWVGTENGLNRFDRSEFINYSERDGLPNNRVKSLFEDSQGRIWIGTQGDGVAVYESETFQANPFKWEDGSKKTVYTIREDGEGVIWLGTDQGLYELRNRKLRPLKLPGIPTGNIYSLLGDERGLWIGSDQGFRLYNGKEVLQLAGFDQVSPSSQVNTMVRDDTGQLWLGTAQGVVRFDGKAFHYLNDREKTLNAFLTASLVDTEGNIWLGTDGGGARKITSGIFEVIDNRAGLSSNLAKSFQEDEKGQIWIATKDRGIDVFRDGQYLTSYTETDGLGDNEIVTSFEDSKGAFWFTSYNGNLTCYDERGFLVFDRSEGLDCNAVYCVSEDAAGMIWVGTDNGVFLIQNDQIVRRLGLEDGLSDLVVYNIQPDREDQMWVGTADGLSIWEHGRFRHYAVDDIVGPNVITLLEDPQGRMWVGSAIGLAYFEDGEGHWLRISGAPGAHTVVSLVLEQEQYLWVGTENGAYRLDLNRFDPQASKASFEHYTQKDGLPSLECNANAAFLDSKGNVWLGTAEGAIFRPAGLERAENNLPPRIYITSVRSNAEDNWMEVKRQFDPETGPELDNADNQLDFSFIGISLKSPQQVEYRYRLNRDPWDRSRPTRQTNVAFNSLSPGTYTFEVVAKKEGDPWSYNDPARFTFTVRPPFWATWWFVSLMGLLVLGVIFAIYRAITARRRQQREEQRIRDKAEKLALEHQALYAMMNPHFTFNALQSIQFFIHRQDKVAANKFLSSFAKLVRKNLESTKSDTITLGEEVERLKLYLSLEKMRFPEKFDYEVVVEPGLDLSDTQIPPMLLQPFVENSIKHGIMSLETDGLIQVRISSEGEDFLRIQIEDNGIGIEASKKRKTNRPSDHVSKGMQITMDRLALFARMNGHPHSLNISEIKDDQETVKGTLVDIVLPIKESI